MITLALKTTQTWHAPAALVDTPKPVKQVDAWNAHVCEADCTIVHAIETHLRGDTCVTALYNHGLIRSS